jgi:hypothetical protein
MDLMGKEFKYPLADARGSVVLWSKKSCHKTKSFSVVPRTDAGLKVQAHP